MIDLEDIQQYRQACRERAYGRKHDARRRLNPVRREAQRVASAQRIKNDPRKRLLGNARARAAKRALSFDLKIEDIVVPKRCPVLGIELFHGAKKICMNSPSIDRIDNSKGYVRGNVLVVSMKANIIKSNASVEEIRRVADFYEKL